MNQTAVIAKIKQLRRKKGYTLERLSDRTGLSKGYLSKIENAVHLPPLSTLHKIAEALGEDLTRLFVEETGARIHQGISIVRRKERPEMTVEMKGLEARFWSLAAQKTGRNMDPCILEIPFETGQVYQHEGEEFYLILEGKIKLLSGSIESFSAVARAKNLP